MEVGDRWLYFFDRVGKEGLTKKVPSLKAVRKQATVPKEETERKPGWPVGVCPCRVSAGGCQNFVKIQTLNSCWEESGQQRNHYSEKLLIWKEQCHVCAFGLSLYLLCVPEGEVEAGKE